MNKDWNRLSRRKKNTAKKALAFGALSAFWNTLTFHGKFSVIRFWLIGLFLGHYLGNMRCIPNCDAKDDLELFVGFYCLFIGPGVRNIFRKYFFK